MERKNKIVLALGLLFWVVGDIYTTHLGFSYGIPEQNPFLVGKSIYEIAVLKVVGVLIILFLIRKIEETKTGIIKIDNWKNRFVNHYPKGLLFYGAFITVFNSLVIGAI